MAPKPKPMPWQIVVVLFAVGLFLTLLVSSTMNAIDDNYFYGVNAFKRPFYRFRYALIIILIFLFIVSIAVKNHRQHGFPLGRAMGLAAVVATLAVTVFGLLPCLYDYASPRTLEKIIAHSLLCPQYSTRSYVWQVLAIIFGTLVFFSSNRWRIAPC